MRKAIKYTADQIKAARKKLQGLEEKDVGKTRIEVIAELEKEISEAIKKGYSLSEIAEIFSEADMQIPESFLKRELKKKKEKAKKQSEKPGEKPDATKEKEAESKPDKLDEKPDDAKKEAENQPDKQPEISRTEEQPDKPAVDVKKAETLPDKPESVSKTTAKKQHEQKHAEGKNQPETKVSDFVKPDIPDDEL